MAKKQPQVKRSHSRATKRHSPSSTSKAKQKPKRKPSPDLTAADSIWGDDLWAELVRISEIPAKFLYRELKGSLDAHGMNVRDLTLDQLRCVTASYLRHFFKHFLDRSDQNPDDPSTNGPSIVS